MLLLVAAVASGADRNESQASHLLVVPAEGEPSVALAKTDARVVARYRTFTLVEASGGDADRLQRAGAEVRDDMRKVWVGRSSLDPARKRSRLTSKDDGAGGPGFAVVQLIGPVKDAWLARLRKTGVRVVTYVAQNGYLVHGSGAQLERAAGLLGEDPAVRGVTPYTAASKLGEGVRTSGSQRLAIQTLSGSDGSAARADVDAAGRELRDTSAVGPFRTKYVVADAEAARALARDPGVVSVTPSPAPELFDETQNQILAGATSGSDPLIPSGPGYISFVDGKVGTATFPFSVDVTDEGIDNGLVATTHPDLQVDGGGATRLDYVDDFTTDTGVNAARDCGGHGTINAGIVGGFNTGTGSTLEDAGGFNYGLGLAPRTKLGGSKIFRCTGQFSLTSTFTALTANAYNKGARISSNSWGCGECVDSYDSESQEYDALVRDAVPGTVGNQQMVEVFAAGNDGSGGGTIGTPGNGKNMITVGASENVRLSGSDGCVGNSGADDAHDVIDFSSRGPAPTGRLKPEIVGPGTHIVGTKPQHGDYTGEGVCTGTFPVGSAFYSISSGTSHSTPAIAGIAALFREWYRQNVGGGTTVPSPAMTKAVIAQSGTDLVGGNNGAGGANTSVPNQIQGWGLANIQRALAGPAQRYFRDQQDVFGATGESLTRVFTVQDTGQPVRVTLAFTDAFGPVGVNPVVNDLNLSVTGAAGTFKGNVFSDGLSATGGTADPINNLESVYLPAGTSGNFSVEVAAANIAGNGVPGNGDATDQDFALTVSNAAEVSAPILSQVSSSVTDQGDADGAIEPGENFGVTDTIRNTGNATASGISGTLAGPPMVSFPDAGAAWPDLPAGQSAANSDPLVGALDAGGICGAPVTLDLQITSTEGAGATIPVSFVTGAAGPPEARNSTNVPQAIPDDSAGGVSSTLAVAETGLIRDVNVRIGSLTHTWVGDLRLELTSPTGTTVVLANRPGGTSNGGNNFTNTVFDDEADGPIGSGAPYTGSFRPQADQLSRFDGEVQEGTWTLKVSDLAPVDTGTLSAWGHDVSPATCDFIPPPPPGGITGLTATPGPEQVALDWDQTPTATSYKVFRRNPDATTYPATPTATPAVSQLTDTGRTPGVEDCYTVRAANASGDGPMSTEVCATPLEPAPLPTPPGAVTGLVSTAGVERVSLDWDDTPGADDYYVWRLNSDGSAPALPTAIVTASQHIDTDRVAGLEQCYKLQAHNEVGTGPLSSPTCATPTAADGGGGGGGGGGVPEIPELPKLDLSGIPGTVKVNRKGRFTLRFSSTDDGMLKLTTVKAFATGRRKKVRQALASSSFTTSPTGQARMRLKLKRRHRRLLKRTRRLKVTATATAGELSAKRTFTLKAPKAKKRRRR